MWKKVLGWFLFAFGVFYMIVYIVAASIIASDTGDYTTVAGLIVYPLFTLLPMWAGWKLAHRR